MQLARRPLRVEQKKTQRKASLGSGGAVQASVDEIRQARLAPGGPSASGTLTRPSARRGRLSLRARPQFVTFTLVEPLALRLDPDPATSAPSRTSYAARSSCRHAGWFGSAMLSPPGESHGRLRRPLVVRFSTLPSHSALCVVPLPITPLEVLTVGSVSVGPQEVAPGRGARAGTRISRTSPVCRQRADRDRSRHCGRPCADLSRAHPSVRRRPFGAPPGSKRSPFWRSWAVRRALRSADPFKCAGRGRLRSHRVEEGAGPPRSRSAQ
jgi:hypothetical protein